MIVQGTTVFVQGQRYQGEVLMNCVALSASVDGPIVFIFKLQDLHAMPQQQADMIASLIVAVDRHLPKVTRGQQAKELNGYMKCALDRHSCCGGNLGRQRQSEILRILKEEVASLRLAFHWPCWTSTAGAVAVCMYVIDCHYSQGSHTCFLLACVHTRQHLQNLSIPGSVKSASA